MSTDTEMWDERCEVHVSWCKEMHLLQTRDGFGLYDRVLVILHHRTAYQTRQTRRRYRICVACHQINVNKMQ